MSHAKASAFCCATMLAVLAAPNMPGMARLRTKRLAHYTASKSRSGQSPMTEKSSSFDNVRQYIHTAWDHLTRSVDVCKTLEDVKTKGEPFLYLPAEFAEPPDVKEMAARCHVRVRHLPAKITEPGQLDSEKIGPEGLLYLPNPYVVPGGQFNEMYGWDSYFIILGLLRENRVTLAKGMVDNFFFEIEHYGGVLNANRTYYLTRSQPPFLTSMILAVYEAEKAAGHADKSWLEKGYARARTDYAQWTSPPHLAGDTGLSRYFDRGNGPVPEILDDPSHYYREVAEYFLMHPGDNHGQMVSVDAGHPAASAIGAIYELFVCGSKVTTVARGKDCQEHRVALTSDYYKGDRSMRESGFDVSFRFGPYGDETHHYAPVCLNSLLYKTELDLAEISALLGKQSEAAQWKQKALQRRGNISKHLWNAKAGLFYDYNFQTRALSSYDFVTAFYPLWVGLATKEQAKAVAAKLSLFEEPGGLTTSRNDSGAQWDYPYGWAPLQLIAVQGVRRYGYTAAADRISYEFLSMILKDFESEKHIREKYDVVTRESVTHIRAGYTTNQIGFGWTNGVFLELLRGLSPEQLARLKTD
ncbi:MAG TPA: trehalase family glycosidase [Candidatus Acidoferrales bacterium]|nr:trehalase family glycosidase [Candidatus Acidoferrales bacterium]